MLGSNRSGTHTNGALHKRRAFRPGMPQQCGVHNDLHAPPALALRLRLKRDGVAFPLPCGGAAAATCWGSRHVPRYGSCDTRSSSTARTAGLRATARAAWRRCSAATAGLLCAVAVVGCSELSGSCCSARQSGPHRVCQDPSGYPRYDGSRNPPPPVTPARSLLLSYSPRDDDDCPPSSASARDRVPRISLPPRNALRGRVGDEDADREHRTDTHADEVTAPVATSASQRPSATPQRRMPHRPRSALLFSGTWLEGLPAIGTAAAGGTLGKHPEGAPV